MQHKKYCHYELVLETLKYKAKRTCLHWLKSFRVHLPCCFSVPPLAAFLPKKVLNKNKCIFKRSQQSWEALQEMTFGFSVDIMYNRNEIYDSPSILCKEK